MRVFWENELLFGNYGTELHFVENLEFFIKNNKDKIIFDNIFAGKHGYMEATAGSIKWRQVEGVSSKEELLEAYEIGKPTKKDQLKCNLSKYYYNLVINELKEKVKEEEGYPSPLQFHLDCCYNIHNENKNGYELYQMMRQTCKCGYSFNECEPDKIYENVNQIDINSFYASIMRSMNFPAKFFLVSRPEYEKILKDRNFFGHFIIKVKRDDPFLFKLGDFNNKTKILDGYFNDLDIDFIEKLCGIEEKYCKVLYTYTTKPIRESVLRAIDYAYEKKKELEGKKERIKYKLFLERLFGNCLKEKFYSRQYVWDKETQELKELKCGFKEEGKDCDITYNFTRESMKTHFDYCWGVWTLSYARLLLLLYKEKLGSNCIYGDVDSLKYLGKARINTGVELGDWKDEGKLKKFRVLDMKWYIGEFENCEKNGKLKIACAGADKTIMENWLNSVKNPIETFSKTNFPEDIKPYKTICKDKDGNYIYKWSGGIKEVMD